MTPAVRVEAGSLTARGERTRSRLVAAGEEVFGRRGFHDASIAEITQGAGVAQGTFYLYFESKRDLLRAVVEERGHELRATLARATEGVSGRVAKEHAGFAAFFTWMARHRALYLIVRQVEYVDSEVYRAWYRQLADGYAAALQRSADAGEIGQFDDVETLAYALMGIGDFVGLRWLVIEKHRTVPPRALATIVQLVERALLAPPPRRPRRGR
ncbi:MAG TPA: TetR/AcrR family transcriptional regulator [Candidatus Dormibacteraeota bacterium]|jgi:AcrR family transcriptional regulator|nr:TetR/AcrR family transcriptional regulator [Candidatus Dormibacteraeota bacterium]